MTVHFSFLLFLPLLAGLNQSAWGQPVQLPGPQTPKLPAVDRHRNPDYMAATAIQTGGLTRKDHNNRPAFQLATSPVGYVRWWMRNRQGNAAPDESEPSRMGDGGLTPVGTQQLRVLLNERWIIAHPSLGLPINGGLMLPTYEPLYLIPLKRPSN